MSFRKDYVITINYPTSASNEPRWGYGKPPHPLLYDIIDRKRADYETLLNNFLNYQISYKTILPEEDSEKLTEPYLTTPWLPGLDSLSLYCLLAIYQPSLYVEIGSGSSTKFARRSIRDYDLKTEIISIDPEPRAEIDSICDLVIRKPVELMDLELFDKLQYGDILFIDNSHRCFMNSDATLTFIDIIPRLNPGVLIEVHDIFLPYDYPPQWINRYYSEQYLLAAYLLAEGQKFDILLPNAFISHDSSLHNILNPIFSDLEKVSRGGGSFWLLKK
jgi:hypothetical protein